MGGCGMKQGTGKIDETSGEGKEERERFACLNQQRSHIWSYPIVMTSKFHITTFIMFALKLVYDLSMRLS